jgi:hypothetical protein
MKPFFFSLLMLIASPAWAGWTLVATSNETPPDKYFLDFETLRKEGNEIRIWQLINLPPNDKYGWGSIRSRNLYDCKNDTVQVLSKRIFTESFAEGKEVTTALNSPSPKSDIAPDTIGWIVLKEVCKR